MLLEQKFKNLCFWDQKKQKKKILKIFATKRTQKELLIAGFYIHAVFQRIYEVISPTIELSLV